MKIAGWASTVDLDFYRHVVRAGAFTQSINEKGISGPKGVKLLLQHDRNKIAGVITKLEARDRGLWIEAELEEGISYVRDVALAIRANKGLSFSVGFYVEDADVGQARDGGEFLDIMRGDLEEVSIVPVPGNENAIMESFE